jgi:arylsulfatase A-like enzyme
MAIASHLDFMATFAEIAGVSLPNVTLDSHSLAPMLLSGDDGKSKLNTH